MFGRRGYLLVIGCMSSSVGVFGCEAVEDAEPFVPSKPGVTQPEAGGDGISEAKACEQLAQVRSKVSADLDCDLKQPTCPELVRPFGTDSCQRYLYDGDSVEACVSVIESYETCEDFARSPCLITALIRPQATCDDSGGAGSGGGGGSGGSIGSGGTSGDGSNSGGSSGAGGAAGQAGAAGGSG